MCGICGIYGTEDRELIQRMVRVMKHRGPDGDGIYTDRNISLGHTRLSIIDLSENGRQPMSNEEGDIWLSVNGEIYNFLELKVLLQSRGHRFRSRSDSEVIIHAYEEYGLDFVKHLRGMFAISVYDSKKQRLVLARDPIGKKPLYYYYDGKKLIFASEIKAILKTGIPRKINNPALWSYLAYQYTIGENTLFEGVKKVLPGTILIIENEKISSQKYWTLSESPINAGEGFFIQRLRDLLEESVRLRLIADVPVGAFLSGGIDSSAIAALAKKNLQSDFHTFSVGFSTFSELEFAQQVSDHIGSIHHEMVITADMVAKDIEKIAWYYDEPLGDSAIINVYYLAEAAKKEVKVVLAGEGGDELFAGYPNYQNNDKLLRIIKNPVLTVPMNTFLKLFGSYAYCTPSQKINSLFYLMKRFENTSIEDFHQRTIQVMFDEEIENNTNLPKTDLSKYTIYPKNITTILDKMLAMDCLNLLPEKYLMKADKGTMANAIEERAPLIDKEIVEFAFSIPDNLKIRGNIEKYILRKAVSDLLPQQILSRPKVGFGTTIGQWMESDLADLVNQKIEEGELISKIYKPDQHKILIQNYKKEIQTRSSKIWTLFALELWYDTNFLV